MNLHEQFQRIQHACDRFGAKGVQFDENGFRKYPQDLSPDEPPYPLFGPAKFHLGPPATESDLQQLEATLDYSLPSSLRKVFLEQVASFGVSWSIKESYKIEGFDPICYGNFILNFSELYHLNEENKGVIEGFKNERNEKIVQWIQLFQNRKPLMQLDNGDMLLIGVGDESRQEIVYYLHDACDGGEEWFQKHGTVLAPNFEEFLDRWSRLAFVGPEIWVIEPFLRPDGLQCDGQNAKNFQNWFFGDSI